MPKTIYRIMGKKGRSTIPLVFRIALDMRKGDTLAYTLDGRTVTVRKERRCECHKAGSAELAFPSGENAEALTRLLDSLTPVQLRAALVAMSVKWAETEGSDER
ncbi:MAG: AbrB/MazE/SpoVT family DNA-binding domain-containing protein [Clostridiales Family XIII bacterium]|jgi:bifunctional DNA-binding transcriptional regulator/antitoxin component of YhaV-PrlF toxin-antitoxin module|nr:AbrB/MazE/SpoVT family DNA-binding domain-containing protein [Clostridiales Family XIII bacterium]